MKDFQPEFTNVLIHWMLVWLDRRNNFDSLACINTQISNIKDEVFERKTNRDIFISSNITTQISVKALKVDYLTLLCYSTTLHEPVAKYRV